MARKRSRIYKAGDKIQVSLNKDLSPEFLEWINKQSDLTNFFLYGVQQLYKETGNIDVATVMPRKIDIDTIQDVPTQILTKEMPEIDEPKDRNNEKEIQSKNEKWENITDDRFSGDLFS